jgi:FAD dependent oxidoreductase TIGR03364
MQYKTAIVIGAGIVGLATARALAIRGYKVTVFERNEKATGASIRNFGMIWPIGQPDGELYETALISRSIWKKVCDDAGIWYDEVGSLHLAHATDELEVLAELAEYYAQRGYQLLDPDETLKKSPCVLKQPLYGSLFSSEELIVDPRMAISQIPKWLAEKYGVTFLWGRAITDIAYPSVFTGLEEWEADEIYICTGADFETLYPDLYKEQPVTKCKLQMMRMGKQKERIGPAICGGLSLAHYKSFKAAASLNELKARYNQDYQEHLHHGIHVMVSQNAAGELTVGDSHEYNLTPDPFDMSHINHLILEYLKKMVRFENETIIETWNGVYAKLTNDESWLLLEPESGVTIINCFGGAGMTLAFGFCEQLFTKKKSLIVSV